MDTEIAVSIPKQLLDAILAGARQLYPRESFLLLRGKKKKNIICISDLVFAPFAVHGNGSASFQPHMLPIDFSIVGTVHSHPSGNISPSYVDLNHSFGRILMIVGFPYDSECCTAVYNSNGDKLALRITENEPDE